MLPMLLESDPKPLGNDVSIQIPPIDQGKFVDALCRPTRAARPRPRPRRSLPRSRRAPTAPRRRPTRTLAAAEQRVLGQSGASRAPAIMSVGPRGDAAADAPRLRRPRGTAPRRRRSRARRRRPAAALFVQVAALADSQAAAELAAKLTGCRLPGSRRAGRHAPGTGAARARRRLSVARSCRVALGEHQGRGLRQRDHHRNDRIRLRRHRHHRPVDRVRLRARFCARGDFAGRVGGRAGRRIPVCRRARRDGCRRSATRRARAISPPSC